MNAVQAPAELIERAADFLRTVQDMGELNWPGDTERTTARLLVAELRALLPQPEPTCPNCGHRDKDHENDAGCWVNGVSCECWITKYALPQVRALLAAERDAKPAVRQPRVWNVGAPQPEVGTVIEDRDGDLYQRHESGWYGLHEGVRCGSADAWTHRLMYAPLTEVLPGGDR